LGERKGQSAQPNRLVWWLTQANPRDNSQPLQTSVINKLSIEPLVNAKLPF
jgi:hypothetical protein